MAEFTMRRLPEASWRNAAIGVAFVAAFAATVACNNLFEKSPEEISELSPRDRFHHDYAYFTDERGCLRNTAYDPIPDTNYDPPEVRTNVTVREDGTIEVRPVGGRGGEPILEFTDEGPTKPLQPVGATVGVLEANGCDTDPYDK